MVLSEAEAQARLDALRRQRDAIERRIADLLLYLDLGRRLGGPPASAGSEPTETPAAAPQRAVPEPVPPRGENLGPGGVERFPQAPGAQPEAGLSETVLARRYGRAVIEAALAVLEEAGRPLHASEILARIAAQGFFLPGQDPVAALNTRLWKRSGPGGPLKRLGDAVYAPADAEEG
ncbi:MAG: HTH domain-containing protein [Methylorubrum populi]